MTEIRPLVDCCPVDESERVFRPGVSPYAIDPDPRKRPISRRSALQRATILGAAALSAACGGGKDGDVAASPASGTDPDPSASSSSSPSGSARPSASGDLEAIDLPYCSQILCGVPLETAVKHGFFEAEGLKVKLVYMKGGALAMQALVTHGVDFVGSALDVLVSAVAVGKDPVMIASLSSLPFFALVTAPHSKIEKIADLKGKKIGVANLNTSDHLLARYLLKKNGLSDTDAAFAPLGPNLFDGLRKGQVDAGLVQEPALSRLQDLGSTVLVNFMKRADVDKFLGGPYQFFGLNTRPDVIEKRPETLAKLVRALEKTNRWVRENPGSEIVKNLPAELISADDQAIFAKRLDEVKSDLYPASLTVDKASVQRVIDVQDSAGSLAKKVEADTVFSNQFVESS